MLKLNSVFEKDKGQNHLMDATSLMSLNNVFLIVTYQILRNIVLVNQTLCHICGPYVFDGVRNTYMIVMYGLNKHII